MTNASTAYVSAGGIYSFYIWMVKVWGFKLSKVKPYDFNSAPFIVNKNSLQEGYYVSAVRGREGAAT